MRRAVIYGLCLAVLAGLSLVHAGDAEADKGPSKKASASKAKAKNDAKNDAKKGAAANGGTAELPEEEILAFAREHHPELADLLTSLKSMKPKEYQKALRQLNQTRQRLVRLKKASSDQYEFALSGWKLDSRIQLLAARMTMSGDSALEEELKGLLSERLDVRVKELTAERKRLAARMEAIDKSIGKIEADREKSLQAELARVKKGMGKGAQKAPKGAARQKAKPEANAKPEAKSKNKSAASADTQ